MKCNNSTDGTTAETTHMNLTLRQINALSVNTTAVWKICTADRYDCRQWANNSCCDYVCI